MARGGATTRQLVDRVRGGTEAHAAVIPILGYLSKAFFVSLPTILPLREDLGTGAFGRAIQIAFWFGAALTRSVDVEPWDWDRFWAKFSGSFSAEELQSLPAAGGRVQFTRPSMFPQDLYARVLFETYIDKSEAFGPLGTELFEQVRQLATGFHEVLMQPAPNGERLSVPMKFEYQVEDQGPKFHVVCMAHALREKGVQPTKPAAGAR